MYQETPVASSAFLADINTNPFLSWLQAPFISSFQVLRLLSWLQILSQLPIRASILSRPSSHTYVSSWSVSYWRTPGAPNARASASTGVWAPGAPACTWPSQLQSKGKALKPFSQQTPFTASIKGEPATLKREIKGKTSSGLTADNLTLKH